MSQSYTTQRDKSTSKLTGYASNSQRFDERNSESSATLASQVESVIMVLVCFWQLVPQQVNIFT